MQHLSEDGYHRELSEAIGDKAHPQAWLEGATADEGRPSYHHASAPEGTARPHALDQVNFFITIFCC